MQFSFEMANLRQKIGQLILIGVEGKSLTDAEKSFIIENNISGVTLFSRNVESPKQLHALNTELQALRHKMVDKSPLFIAIDMEGGRVARLKAPFTQWPPLAQLGKLDSPSLAFKFAETMGKELKAIGINLDFAPCVDVFTNPENTVIGDRSLGSDPELVAKLASALVRGYVKSDVIACVKHFPGHGNTKVDSHFDLPVEDHTDLKRLHDIELPPFKKSFRARVDLVMTAHMMFPKIDKDWPVTLSEIFLKQILKKDLGYRGLTITDDLDMKALAKHWPIETIPVRALQAGADLLLYCNEPKSPPIALDAVEKAVLAGSIPESQIDDIYARVLQLKKARIKHPDPLPMSEASLIIGHPDHLKLSKAIVAGEIPADLAT